MCSLAFSEGACIVQAVLADGTACTSRLGTRVLCILGDALGFECVVCRCIIKALQAAACVWSQCCVVTITKTNVTKTEKVSVGRVTGVRVQSPKPTCRKCLSRRFHDSSSPKYMDLWAHGALKCDTARHSTAQDSRAYAQHGTAWHR